jgi:hypothetical protein
MHSLSDLIKSKVRVDAHGEVFTPAWLVEEMLDLVKTETERIDSRFLEPACGSGNFLREILLRKLMTVQAKYGKSNFERQNQALFALMCTYGIELLADNVQECRQSLLDIYSKYLQIDQNSIWFTAGKAVLEVNIVHGDALTLTTIQGNPISFPEWGYLGLGKFQRRDFRYDTLTQRSSIHGTLFESLEEHELFVATKSYPVMTVEGIGK